MVWQQLDLSESQYVGIQATEGEESQDRRGLHPGSRAGKEKKFCGSVCCSLEQPSVTDKKVIQREILKHMEELAGTSSGTWVLHRGCVCG